MKVRRRIKLCWLGFATDTFEIKYRQGMHMFPKPFFAKTVGKY